MDYLQERVTTLHNLTDAVPAMPRGDSAVVVPIAGESEAAVTPTHVFEALETVGPSAVVVPLRAPSGVAAAFDRWTDHFALDVTTLWCNAPTVAPVLDDHGLDGPMGKGRDVWLGLGIAANRADYVAVHDADATTYSAAHVPRLLAGLALGHEFVKGYYARVENNALYGRLFRLFYAPLLQTLAAETDAPVVEYLAAFRYALAGEFAATGELISTLRVQRSWGLEVGTLGDAYAHAGFENTAQVDLGAYEHDHRAVGGPAGLSEMSSAVGDALFRVVGEHGVEPDYSSLPDRYRSVAARFVDQYAVDAAYNGLDYDRSDELDQVEAYSETIGEPGVDSRLPAWVDAPIAPAAVAEAAAADLAAATEDSAGQSRDTDSLADTTGQSR